jgi:hypothetical protein
MLRWRTRDRHKCNKMQRRACRAWNRQRHQRDVNLTPAQGADGESVMSVVLTDLMLFLCLALFFTGIMIAGAMLVG